MNTITNVYVKSFDVINLTYAGAAQSMNRPENDIAMVISSDTS